MRLRIRLSQSPEIPDAWFADWPCSGPAAALRPVELGRGDKECKVGSSAPGMQGRAAATAATPRRPQVPREPTCLGLGGFSGEAGPPRAPWRPDSRRVPPMRSSVAGALSSVGSRRVPPMRSSVAIAWVCVRSRSFGRPQAARSHRSPISCYII